MRYRPTSTNPIRSKSTEPNLTFYGLTPLDRPQLQRSGNGKPDPFRAASANPGGCFRVSEHLAVFVPTGRPVNTVTGTNWEGVGVQPDVDVKVEDALTRAHALALEKLLAVSASDPTDLEARRKALTALRAE